jgi:hypothetical protein
MSLFFFLIYVAGNIIIPLRNLVATEKSAVRHAFRNFVQTRVQNPPFQRAKTGLAREMTSKGGTAMIAMATRILMSVKPFF